MNKIYLPSVPVNEQIDLMMSDLYRPALHITSKIPALQVSSYRWDKECNAAVLDFMASGCNILRITQRPGSRQLVAAIAVNCTSIYGFDPMIDTAKPMYMAKALTKRTTKAGSKLARRIEDAARVLQSFMEGHIRLGYNSLVGNRRLYMNYRDTLNNGALAALVHVFFNEQNAIDVRPEVREALERVRAERDSREESRKEVNGLMQRMFEPRKWLITYMPLHGYVVRKIDVAHSWDVLRQEATNQVGDKPGVVEVIPMQHYRSLEDMPETMKEQILPSLTYAKLHMQGRHPQLKFEAEPDDLVPYLGDGNRSIMSAETGVSYLTFDSTRSVLIDAD